MRGQIIREIARHERKMLFSGWRFTSCAVFFVSVFLTALFAGWSDFRRTTQENRQAERNERFRWLNQGVKGPHAAADQGMLVFQPLPPLSVFDSGVLPYTGSRALVGGHHEEILTGKAAEGAHSLHRLSSLSAAAVLQVLLPLLFVLLLYDTLAAERERGTLGQILSSGVSTSELVWGKLIGIAEVVGVMMAAIVIATATILRHSMGRFSMLALIYTAYLVIVIVLIVAISARASTSRQALVILLCGWAWACVISPVVLTDIAQGIHPSPTSLQYAAAEMDAAGKMPTVEERRAVVRARLLAQYRVTSLRELPVDPIGIELIEEEREAEPLYGNLVGSVYDSYEQQNRFYRLGAVFSPLAAVQPLSMAVSGTDFTACRDFGSAAEQYRRGMIKIINDAIAYNPGYRQAGVFPGTDIIVTKAGRELWERIPEFAYSPPDPGALVSHIWTSVFLLVFWMVTAVVLLWRSTMRLQPR